MEILINALKGGFWFATSMFVMGTWYTIIDKYIKKYHPKLYKDSITGTKANKGIRVILDGTFILTFLTMVSLYWFFFT